MIESLRRMWFRRQDPLRAELGARYDQAIDGAELKRRALERSGGALPADCDTRAIPGATLERAIDEVIAAAGAPSVAAFSYLESRYDARAREKPDFADWFVSFQTSRRVAELLRDTIADLRRGIRPGASEVLAP